MAEDGEDEDGDNDEDVLIGWGDDGSDFEFEGEVVGDSDVVELQDILLKVSVILGQGGWDFLQFRPQVDVITFASERLEWNKETK